MAVRKGPWKLVYEDAGLHLYNLDDDLGENNDLLQRYPDKAAQLQTELSAWEKQMSVYNKVCGWGDNDVLTAN